MKCLILAGGFGTRLNPQVVKKPKPLLEYKNKPLVSHIVAKIPLDTAILIATNRKFEPDFQQWQETIDRQVELCIEDSWTEQQKKGAVSSLNLWIERKHITEDLLVIAGDNYFEFDLADFMARYNGKNTLVATYDISNKTKASQFGVVQVEGHRITSLEEKPARPSSSLIATACYIFPSRIFPLLSRYCSEGQRDNLGNLISYFIDTDEVHAYTFTEFWLDIGSFNGLA